MKKLLIGMSVGAAILMLSACTKDKAEDSPDNSSIASPTPLITAMPDVEDRGDNSGTDAVEEKTGDIIDTLIAKDYYPLKADTEYVYAGTGNEFASFTTYVDYLDEAKGRLQTRTNNGGTETVRVLEYRDGKLYVLYTVNECYYRDNFLDTKANTEDAEILLMEPIMEGTQWSLPDGSKRRISATEVMIETPTGTYSTIEVTTEYEDSTTKDYYAKGTGLIKSLFQSGGLEITSTLSKMNKATPLTRSIEIYYPNMDEKIYGEVHSLTFYTGDISRDIIREALAFVPPKASYLPLISTNTKINSLYLGEDGIVYVDFSSDLIKDMNAGAGFELLILQSITNTLGMYYGAGEVYLTVDGKPYESGHILMKKAETMEVNMEQVSIN